jgi:archaellum biogenesis ATPase FlaH
MRQLGALLSDLPLPEPPPHSSPEAGEVRCGDDLLDDLGAGLPAGHVHLWGGPQGAGKTSFLLSLLCGAAKRRRRGVFATYHLPAPSLAVRLLAMAAEVDPRELVDGAIAPQAALRAAAVRRRLVRLPLHVLEARGLSVRSLRDRIVRLPFRPDVLVVDYLQAVIRPPGTDLGHALREFASLASQQHVAVVLALGPGDAAPLDVCRLADRAGWIAPAGGSGLRRAEVIQNRYGRRTAVPLRFDANTGTLHRLDAPHGVGAGETPDTGPVGG